MADALSSGVTGLKAHQKMLDVAGNNLANINTIGYKADRIIFSELLSETVRRASGPGSLVGGLNPQQLGSGVGVAGLSKNMSQGSFESTGKDLDMAISGNGYFVVSDGIRELYSRVGAFSIDSDGVLVDSQSGYRVQRYGSIGESMGFQTSGDTAIHIPPKAVVALPAKATTTVQLVGNLKENSTDDDKVANKITAASALTTSSGYAAAGSTIISLDQFTAGSGTDAGGFGAGETGTIRVRGTRSNGTTAVNATFTVDGSSTMQDVLDGIRTAFGDSVTATLQDGKIVVTDDSAGYSRTVVSSITYETASSGGESLSLPTYYKLTAAGAEDSQNFSIGVYDSFGGHHIMQGTLVKTGTANTWDAVIMSVSGEVDNPGTTDRRIVGIQFNTDGSLKGMASTSEPKTVGLRFQSNPTATQTITFDIGTNNSFEGLTQSAAEQGKTSTVVARSQDGYSSGKLSSLNVNSEGKLVGTFSNGQKKNIAAIKLALFENSEGLESVGNGYFVSTENSGEAVASMAQNGGAGSIQGQKLEKSNVDTANEFVALMQAQSGFQANARTITVANDVLKELTNIVR